MATETISYLCHILKDAKHVFHDYRRRGNRQRKCFGRLDNNSKMMITSEKGAK